MILLERILCAFYQPNIYKSALNHLVNMLAIITFFLTSLRYFIVISYAKLEEEKMKKKDTYLGIRILTTMVLLFKKNSILVFTIQEVSVA